MEPLESPSELQAKKDRALLAVKKEAARRGYRVGNGGHGMLDCPIPGCKGTVKFIVYSGTGLMMASCNRCVLVNVRE